MQAIILAGGFGTRLRSVLNDTPKPMAPIGDQPFLELLLLYLARQNFSEVTLSVGYLHEKIIDHFGEGYQNIALRYAIETTPLGTGGAIRHALGVLKPVEPVFVLNGDTFSNIDYATMSQIHQQCQSPLTLALTRVDNAGRYGKVSVAGGRITEFQEKTQAGSGLINSGIYLISPNLFDERHLPESFSFEQDFLYPHVAELMPCAFENDGYFIDIGIPEDYQRAQRELPALLASH